MARVHGCNQRRSCLRCRHRGWVR